MKRRHLLLGAASCAAARTMAKTAGQTLSRPLFLHGPVTIIIWADPHPHLELLHRPGARNALRNWARLLSRSGGPDATLELLDDAVVPPDADGARWRVELPALARLRVAGVPRPKIDQVLGVLGTWRTPVTGTPTVDAQVFFIDGAAYPLPPVGSA